MTRPDAHARRRAALLAVVIFIHGWLALPIGPRISAERIKEPDAAHEVDVWMRAVEPLGISRAAFEDFIVTWSNRLVDLDGMARTPVRPLIKFTRTGQGWALFAGADHDPVRLQVVGETADGEERILFRRLDPEARFLAPILDYRRIRGVYDLSGRGMPPRYKNLATWVGEQALEAHPDLVSVVMEQEERWTPLPGEDVHKPPRMRYRVITRRSDLDGGAP